VTLEVRSAGGAACADGELGELWVQAPFLATGYAGNPEATATAFVGGWYRTGDLGVRHDGLFYVRGRSKDVLIVAGHNVFPDDIEALIGALPGIRGGRVAAFGTFDPRLQTERVTVLAEPDGADEVDRAAVLRALSAALNLTGVHFALVEPAWLVKSSSGKISRSQSAAKWRRSQLTAIPTQARSEGVRAHEENA
jgi:acyl-CoA synthetase (AMP-forming)/AMP-acid ligase II